MTPKEVQKFRRNICTSRAYTNRSLEEIRIYAGIDVQKEVEEKLKTKTNLVVLDVACGFEAYAITELAEKRSEIFCYGLDQVILSEKIPKNLCLIMGDSFELPFNGSTDLLYCSFLFNGGETHHLIDHLFTEFSRALSVGGTALLNTIYAGDDEWVEKTQKYLDKVGKYTDREFKLTNPTSKVWHGHSEAHARIDRLT